MPQTPPALGPSGTQQFAASVSGSSNQTVTWTVSSGLGSISPTGLYTAPSTITSTSSATVRATSQADTSKFDQVTITLNPPPAGPSIANFSPLNQSGYDVTFSMLAQGGGSPVDAVQVYVDNTLDGVGGCLLWYEQSENRIYLGGDSNPYNWVGSVTIGSSSTVQNSQCYLYGTGSSRGISGNNTNLSVHVQFKSSWTGVKQIHHWIQNTALAANGWNHAGNWTVTAPPSGVTPSTGGTFPNQLLQLTANTNPPGSAVYWTLSPSQGTITSAGLYKAPSTITTQQNVTATARLVSNNSLIGSATVTLKPLVGTSGAPPQKIYASPTGASGFGDVFRFDWRDPQGPTTIDEARVRFSNTYLGGTDAGLCSFRWTRANNRFELFNDAGTALLPPVTEGSPEVENSSCRLIPEGIHALAWGTENWEIRIGIGFKKPWAAGTKYIEMWARDNTGRESGWEPAGTWGFASNTTNPVIEDTYFTPRPGTVSYAQTYRLVTSDASGRGDIDGFQFVIGDSPSSANVCHLFYFRDSNYGVLLDDNPTQWAGTAEMMSWAAPIQNSQCVVMMGQSAKGDDNSVANGYFLQPRIDIKTAYLGTRKIWALVADNAGNHSDYQLIGQYTFTGSGAYNMEFVPFYKRDKATGQRELWVEVRAHRQPEPATVNPAQPNAEPKPEAR